VADPESINRLLTTTAKLLDSAAAEIRDARLEPVSDNIHRIGRALVEVYEIQQAIYSVQPALTPSFLNEQSNDAESNRLLTEYFARGIEREHSGDITGAIAEFEHYLTLESSVHHRAIAIGQIERLRSVDRP